jgi:NAD(P)-dependent dehydrogenase (short-subunit alcohol dehydrogenase family)
VTTAPARFQDRVALVTGGASGIGRATCERLAAEGASVWIADVDGDRATAVAETVPGAHGLRVDVADEASVRVAVESVLAADGRIDVLVNNAGVTLGAPLWETDPADWQRVLDVNLTGVFLGCRAVLPHMIAAGRGAIVNTASDAGLVGWPGQSAYCASKGGVVLLTKSAAMDAAPYGVRVNCVCPGFTATPLVDAWIDQQDDPEQARAEIEQGRPLGRMGRPEEVAAAIAYLASDEAAFVTGIALPIDGGGTAGG